MKKNYVFTYGTLLKGEVNHDDRINDDDYVCDGAITGYQMFHLGSYPGIKEGEGVVLGELYSVDDETLSELDAFEGEGWLYVRKKVIVKTLNQDYEAFVYVYNLEVDESKLIGNGVFSWKNLNKEYVWYVSYGSNLLLERFLLYITGGYNKRIKVNQDGCDDKSLPLLSKNTIIPYRLYFANSSRTWNKGGVAFIDVNTPGQTYGRAYLITKEQLSQVQDQEGGWYQNKFYLGEIDGIPAYTLTSYVRYPKNTVDHKYENVITDGLVEMGLEWVEAIKYLKTHQQ